VSRRTLVRMIDQQVRAQAPARANALPEAAKLCGGETLASLRLPGMHVILATAVVRAFCRVDFLYTAQMTNPQVLAGNSFLAVA
jgi:hypothetical protein